MSYNYFYGQSGELFSYFRIPKALFQDHRFRQLSTDARTLYGILLDRIEGDYYTIMGLPVSRTVQLLAHFL